MPDTRCFRSNAFKQREEIRDILKELHPNTGVTVLMVTHDFAQARYLAQNVAVINNGHIEQTGTVESIF